MILDVVNIVICSRNHVLLGMPFSNGWMVRRTLNRVSRVDIVVNRVPTLILSGVTVYRGKLNVMNRNSGLCSLLKVGTLLNRRMTVN